MTVKIGSAISPPVYNKERKNRKWEIRWVDAHGSPRVRSFGNREEASVVRKSLLRSANSRADSPAFEEIGQEFLKSTEKQDGDEGRLILHVLPNFRGTNISEISDDQVTQFHKKIFAKGFHSSTIHRIFRVFIKCIELAIRRGQFDADRILPVPKHMRKATPSARARAQHRERIELLSLDETRKLLRHSHGYLRIVLLLAIRRGLRIGEILALEWRDIDFQSRTIFVRASVRDKDRIGRQDSRAPTTIRDLGVDPNKGYRKRPKTGSSQRVIKMPGDLGKALLKWRADGHNPSDRVVFSGCVQRTHHTVYNHYRRLQVQLGMAEITSLVVTGRKVRRVVGGYTMHHLRHTCAAICFWKGKSAEKVAQMLGHKDKSTTIDRYGYLIRQYKNGSPTWDTVRSGQAIQERGDAEFAAERKFFGDRLIRNV